MTKERASLGFADELNEFNPADWNPNPPKNNNDRPDPDTSRKAAEAAGFKSREPKPVAAATPKPAAAPINEQGAPLRRRRTGRNAQLNLKARPETIEAFYALADGQGWGLGETLEHAIAALERETSKRQ